MKKLPFYFFICLVFTSLCNCNQYAHLNNKQLIELKPKDKLAIYIKNYFKLSEERNIEIWYKTYLNKCTTFYKIVNPTKDSIFNLIKSYWISSNNQKHEITKIESQNGSVQKSV